MDLWILSQDKTELVKVNNLAILDYRIVFINNGYGRATLGTYKTKERALEVLNEIQSILKPVVKSKYIFSTNKDTQFIQFNTYVYEMPEE